MDAERFKEAYRKLKSLDERMTHKIRTRASGGLVRPSSDQLEARLRDLSSYTVELREVVEELFLAIAGKKQDE